MYLVVFIKLIFSLADVVFIVKITVALKIEKMIVPEVIQITNSSEAVLDCQYSGVSDQFTIQWLFNGSEVPVYQWSPRTEPKVDGILEEHLDLSYRVSHLASEERRALRIVALEPELSGDYTCRLVDQGAEARQTKTMLIFSPEKEFLLQLNKKSKNIDIKCTARGLFPQPELILEYNGIILPKQQQRTWRSDGLLFDTESTAHLPISVTRHAELEKITCRLQLPQAGYTAIKKEMLYIGKECSNKSSKPAPATTGWILIIIAIYY